MSGKHLRSSCALSSFFALWLLVFGAAAIANTTTTQHPIPSDRKLLVFTSYVEPDNIGYSRRAFENELIKLALEKIALQENLLVDVRTAQFNSNSARELRMMLEHEQVPFVRSFAVSNELLQQKNLRFIEFPIMRGALSYRICLSSKFVQEDLQNSNSLDDFKKFVQVNGLGWLDTKILRHAGVTVIEAGAYNRIVQMVARRRADLLCRGVNEIQSDWLRYKPQMANLVMDEKYLIFYPLPRYLFSHKANQHVLDRIAAGLALARVDGSFQQLWQRYHLHGLLQAQLDKRQLFVLENPFIDGTDRGFLQHFYTVGEQETTAKDFSATLRRDYID